MRGRPNNEKGLGGGWRKELSETGSRSEGKTSAAHLG